MVEIIDDVAAFERLRPEWTRLLQASAADSLFLTWEWLFTWWKHLAGDRRLFILTVRSGDELIAIAPFARSAPRVASILPLPSLEFLGTGTVGSDYLDIIVRRGSEQEALGTARSISRVRGDRARARATQCAAFAAPQRWRAC